MPDAVESVERLALGMQRFTAPAGEPSRSPDRLVLVHLVGFGDRRKAHDLPRLLGEHMANEIILVQPLHDDDDGAVALVVEPAVEGVVKPVVGRLPLGVGERFLGL